MISSAISFIFFKFLIFFFWVGDGGGGGVGGLKGNNHLKSTKFCPSHSLSQELYIISRCLVRRYKIMILPGVFLYFLLKIQRCRYQNPYVFIAPRQQFLSTSINAKKTFWSEPHLLHMCVIFTISVLKRRRVVSNTCRI